MIRSKLFQVLTLFCALASGTARAQELGIFISEYSASNITGPTDDLGEHSDWIEIESSFSSSVSLGSYYLSNDPSDLLKWRFPADFVLSPGQVKVVWLTGRNTVAGGQVHANFTLEQCKEQWLILTTDQKTVRDSIFVKPTKPDHTRGRIANKKRGNELGEWRLFTDHSFLQTNNKTNHYIDYAPTPQMYVSSETDFSKPGTGGFYPGGQIVYFKLNGTTYDSTGSCFHIYYTRSNKGLASNYPVPGDVGTIIVPDSLTGFITIDQTTVVRAIAVSNPTLTTCAGRYLPSFCETNTYFTEAEHQDFDERFGVMSLAFDKADTSWFTAQGPPGHTIHVEYYEGEKQICEGYGILSRPPQEKWLTGQKGFEITMDDRQGFGCGFQGNIFNIEELGTSTRTLFPTLHVYAGDLESHSPAVGSGENTSSGTGMRDILIQSLAARHKINVNPLRIKPLVVLKEAKYYGCFSLREVFDKHYERFYHDQAPESLTMNYVQNGFENHVTYHDGSESAFEPGAFRSEVYDFVMNNPMDNADNYQQLMSVLDKSSMIDFFITSSFAVNMNIFRYDVAFAKGAGGSGSGGKWHYYLWNMPSTFSFTNIVLPGSDNYYIARTPCHYYFKNYLPIPPLPGLGFMGHGPVFKKLMTSIDNRKLGAYNFQREFRNRYQDLMNGPFGCDELLTQFDYLNELYLKEMQRHEDPALGNFGTIPDSWQANMDSLRLLLEKRCVLNESFFNTFRCFGTAGPYPLTVDVNPAGAGRVQLNSTILDSYVWSGKYFTTQLSFKAIPTNSTYAFHHWEFQNHTPLEPASLDSVNINFSVPAGDNVVAVFTDRSRELVSGSEGANIPTGFTPNGDGLNDIFRPLGSAEFADNFEMVVFNRWGQEVFRSVDAAQGWDGMFHGKQAITGVYAYVISYRNLYGEDKVAKGNVTLTR